MRRYFGVHLEKYQSAGSYIIGGQAILNAGYSQEASLLRRST
jgi:hypothetical protein